MSSHAPLDFVWDNEVQVLRPYSPYWARRAAAIFGAGECLKIIATQERSAATHRHYFATVYEAWSNLPPLMADRFPTDEHLRKWALIQAGYVNRSELVCDSPTGARRAAAWAKNDDEYCVVTVHRNVMVKLTAQSQAVNKMDKKTFRESKDKVLDIIAAEIGVGKRELSDNAGQAA